MSLELAFITGSRRTIIKQPLEITDAEEPTLKRNVYKIEMFQSLKGSKKQNKTDVSCDIFDW